MVAVLLIFLLAGAGEFESDETMLTYGYSMVKSAVDLFTNMSFIVFTSVMLASFIASAYKNKTIHLMFSYPISRKKILLSQMLSVWIFNFIALALSKILLFSALVLTKEYTHITATNIALGSGIFYIELLISSAVMVSICFIALLIGLFMKSSKAVIIAGAIISCLTQGNIGAYTLVGSIPFYAALLAISALSVFLILYQAETRDVP